MKLSIIVPCYNEEKTLREVLCALLKLDFAQSSSQIVVVDDGSTDQSISIAEELVASHPDKIQHIKQPNNQGKGAAVIRGITEADGDIVVIQDADLEYEPEELIGLLECFNDPEVKVVFGSRILGSTNRSYNRYYWGGRLITMCTNLLYGSKITDEPTCYKMFRKSALDGIELVSTGFEFCPEITAKFLRKGYRIVEVPISYRPRSFEEGKKIRWSDGIIAIWTLIKYRFSRI